MKEMGGFKRLVGWSEVRLPIYKARPSEHLPVVLDREPSRVLAVKWGFKPNWVTAGSRLLINARAETVNQKPAFREAFRERRCLILADGFYEWRASPSGKLPFRITLLDGQAFAFAGVWQEVDGEPAYTIITTRPNDVVRPIHDRMPVILSPDEHELWLDPGLSVEEGLKLLDPPPLGRNVRIPGVPGGQSTHHPRSRVDRASQGHRGSDPVRLEHRGARLGEKSLTELADPGL